MATWSVRVWSSLICSAKNYISSCFHSFVVHTILHCTCLLMLLHLEIIVYLLIRVGARKMSLTKYYTLLKQKAYLMAWKFASLGYYHYTGKDDDFLVNWPFEMNSENKCISGKDDDFLVDGYVWLISILSEILSYENLLPFLSHNSLKWSSFAFLFRFLKVHFLVFTHIFKRQMFCACMQRLGVALFAYFFWWTLFAH